jgi:hypothetical protein
MIGHAAMNSWRYWKQFAEIREKHEIINRIEEFATLKVNADGVTEDGRPSNYKPLGRGEAKDLWNAVKRILRSVQALGCLIHEDSKKKYF